LFLKIFGAFLTLRVWWISSTYNEICCLTGPTVKHYDEFLNYVLLHRYEFLIFALVD